MKSVDKAARDITYASGTAPALVTAISLIVVWIAGGFFFGFDELYQLVANTFTTLITFAMVFAIQNSQNRDTAAIQAKLDEIIAATHGARNALVGIEKDSDEREIEAARKTREEC